LGGGKNIFQMAENGLFAKVRLPFQAGQYVTDHKGRRAFYFAFGTNGVKSGGYWKNKTCAM